MSSPTTKAEVITPKVLKGLLSLDVTTGRLYWRERTPDHFRGQKQNPVGACNAWNARYSGNEALTTETSQGYLHGSIFGRKFKAHRVIWALQTGEWPNGEVDHINGNKRDNRIANLRDVDRQGNAKNQKQHKTNASGVNGVTWDKANQKWHAYIEDSLKRNNLGFYANMGDAIEARQAAEIRLNYHPLHGSKR